jgi:hypothetical protein
MNSANTRGADESAVQVGGHHGAPFLKCRLQHGLEHRHTGVVDQGVDAAESGHHLRRCQRHLRRVRHIAVDGQHIIRARDFCCGAVECGSVYVQKHHFVALAKKPFSDGKADATGCASDNGYTESCWGWDWRFHGYFSGCKGELWRVQF